MEKQLLMGYGAKTFLAFPMPIILFISSLFIARSSKAIVSWNLCSFKNTGADMLYWLRNGVMHFSKPVARKGLKSWPERAAPQGEQKYYAHMAN